MSEESDEELVRAYQGGDEVALATFVERHQDLATRWVARGRRAAGNALRFNLLPDDYQGETVVRLKPI